MVETGSIVCGGSHLIVAFLPGERCGAFWDTGMSADLFEWSDKGEREIVIIKATEKHLEGIMKLCKECSQNRINNSIDQWDDICR